MKGKVGDSDILVGTSGIVFDRDCNYYDVANTKISVIGVDVTIKGSNSAIQVVNANKKDVTGVFDVTKGSYSSDISEFLPSSYCCSYDSDTKLYTPIAANVSTGNRGYATIGDAVKAAADGAVVKVISTLELNGFTSTCHSVNIGEGGDLTIIDGSQSQKTSSVSLQAASSAGATGGILITKGSQVAGINVEHGGRLSLERGSVFNEYSNDKDGKTKNQVIRVLGDTTNVANEIKSALNIGGGKVASDGSTAVSVLGKGATINMTGGDLVSGGLACIAGSGKENFGGTTINISGGTLTATAADKTSAACGIYHPQEGTLNITGGTINVTDGVGVLMRGGKMAMTGGEVNATGDASKTGTVGDSRQVVPTSGVVLDRECEYPSAPTAVVKIDKTAKVSGAKAAVELLAKAEDTQAKEAIQLKGGTYSSDVSAYCVDGFTATPNTDGTYGITEVGDAMLVYDKGYTDVKAGNDVEIDMDNISKVIIKAEVADVNVTLKKTFAYTGWNSIWLPFDVTLTADMLANFKFAKLYNLGLDDNENATLLFKNLKAGDKLKANFPCLIQPATTGEQTLALGKVNFVKPVDGAMIDCSSTEELYTFYAATENTYTAAKNGYYISSETSSFVYNTNKEAYIQPFKYYITIQNRDNNSYILPSQPSAQKVSYRVIDEGEATGITDIDADAKTVNAKVYNLQGVQVGTSTEGLPKGIYIQNGRKIMVK